MNGDKNKKKIYLAGVVVIVALFLLAQSARVLHAEDFSGMNITLAPAYPAPESRVSAGISTYSFDINKADYVWRVDGKTVSSGNERYISFNAPALGKTKTIAVYATAADGSKYSKEIILRGNDLDLLYESLSYIPSWYRGKAVPVPDSRVKITAVPFLYSGNTPLKKSELVYDWRVNDRKRLADSGVGKDSVTVFINGYDENTINVIVSSAQGDVVFGRTLSLKTERNKPKILFYEDNPLEGIKTSAALTGEKLLTQGEIGLRAEPFFFPRENLDKLSFNWEMNGKTIVPDNFVVPNVLSFRIGEDTKEGLSLIELTVQDAARLLLKAAGSLRIRF